MKKDLAKNTEKTVEISEEYKEAQRRANFYKKFVRTYEILKNTPHKYGQVLEVNFETKKLIKTNK